MYGSAVASRTTVLLRIGLYCVEWARRITMQLYTLRKTVGILSKNALIAPFWKQRQRLLARSQESQRCHIGTPEHCRWVIPAHVPISQIDLLISTRNCLVVSAMTSLKCMWRYNTSIDCISESVFSPFNINKFAVATRDDKTAIILTKQLWLIFCVHVNTSSWKCVFRAFFSTLSLIRTQRIDTCT